MSVMRSLLLAGSRNQWLRETAPRFSFVRKTVSRFMPGEDLEDAIAAARQLQEAGMTTMFTQLGENVTTEAEAQAVADHYLHVLRRISEAGLQCEVSVKLTQLGLDLSASRCYEHVRSIAERAPGHRTVWIDMESSEYVDRTLDLYRRAKAEFPNLGICLQAYLYRTAKDLEDLLPLAPAIRVVKGAYKEPPEVAMSSKRDVDENFFRLTTRLLSADARGRGANVAVATHDTGLIRRITEWAAANGVGKRDFEIAMLFGIQRAEQQRLAREGYRSVVLVAYGSFWFPWFMRRLAERPANTLFVLKNLFAA